MNQWWLNMLTHVCITQPQWVNWMVTQLVYIGIPSNDSWGCPAGIQANPHDYVSLANCPDRSFPGLCSGHRREGGQSEMCLLMMSILVLRGSVNFNMWNATEILYPNTHRAQISIMVADDLVPNGYKVISNHHMNQPPSNNLVVADGLVFICNVHVSSEQWCLM